MHRRWLIVGLCFCAFSGCVSCQSNYDYCGPMPDEGGDFMYRKNSILGGDPSMPLADGTKQDQVAEGEEAEGGPEPTPAPDPDDLPGLGIDSEGDEDSQMLPSEDEPQAGDEAADESESDEEQTNYEEADAERETVAEQPISTLQWHAPAAKPATSPLKQARFR